MDNNILSGVNCIKLLLENKFYTFIKDTPYETKLRQQGFFKGDCKYLSVFPNNTLRYVHNIPSGDHFFENLAKRCENFNNFYKKVKCDPRYYFIITLNQDMIEYKTGNLKKNNTLINIINYLKEINLFNKVIFVGSRVKTIKYDAFDYYLNDNSYALIKKLFPDINYIEVADVDVWNQAKAEYNFKIQINRLMAKKNITESNHKKQVSYLGYDYLGI